MNVEEPVFNIIHNYRRPEARRPARFVDPPAENDSDQLELLESPSTNATVISEEGQERQENEHPQ